MGYVHETGMSQWFGPNTAHIVTGTWTDAAGQVTGTIVKLKAAADVTAVLTVPIALPSNSESYKGSYLVSIDVYYEVVTAALDALTAVINLITLPEDGAAIEAVTALPFTYDTGHDTAAERIDVDQHKMTLTLTTPIWLDNDSVVQAQLSVDAAATGTFEFIGMRANYTLRL